MTTWLLATRSAGKLAELVPMLHEHGISAIGLAAAGVAESPDEEGIEVFDTFEANAIAKAEHFTARTGLPCLADDSGLCVDALDGRPGVRSRRFARDMGRALPPDGDEDLANSEAMLEACWNSGWAPSWAAHYACAAAYADGARTLVEIGRTHGAIIPERAGTGGFGYDPWFLSADLGTTFALASREAKARVSHRGRAFAALLAHLGQP